MYLASLAQCFFGALYMCVSVNTMLIGVGRVTGISDIISGISMASSSDQARDDSRWRGAFVTGLFLGGAVLRFLVDPDALGWYVFESGLDHISTFIVAGFLVGFGSKLGSGCTSGHMLCGTSRLSPRSIIATCVFCAAAMATVALSSAHDASVWSSTAMVTPDSEARTWITAAAALASLVLVSVTTLPFVIKWGVAATTLWSGIVFGTGLGLAGMTRSSAVLGFLILPYKPALFNPSLLMVIAGALLPSAAIFHSPSFKNLKAPLVESVASFSLPTKRDIDVPLIAGSVLFGIGWGLCGICPGPAIVQLATLQPHVVAFVGAMLGGFKAAALVTPS